jgi:hypothetical protein
MPEATWKPHETHGQLRTQSDLPDTVYAFPQQRKEPLTDAEHVRNAGPFDVDLPDAFSQAFVMEKDRRRFAASRGWGYAWPHPCEMAS